MEPRDFLYFLSLLEKLKCSVRHGWTSTGRRESVAEHTFRLASAAYLLRDSFPGVDMERVLRMAVVHDWGEAVTGDIPAFYKTGEDLSAERSAVDELLSRLPKGVRDESERLFSEFETGSTAEGRLCRALDKLEAVLQHNEAPLSTWIPLEYELNLNYGFKEAEEFPSVKALRELVREDSVRKIETERPADGELRHVGTRTLETERLVLRRFSEDDAQAMFKNWAGDPEVTKYLIWKPYKDADGVRKYLSGVVKGYDDNRAYEWAIVLKESGEPVGSIAAVEVDDRAKRVHIGYCLGREFWNRGIMTEALGAVIGFFFDTVGMNRVDSRHDTKNPASGRVMQKCGMKREGMLRQGDANNSGTCDAVWYGILREEYDEIKKPNGRGGC